jgi:hypothetical protein
MQASPARSRPESEIELPSAVAQVLRQVPDGLFRARLFKVLTNATRAIIKLREIDLSRVEHLTSSQEGNDLALWEQIAPAVAASIGDVNGLLTTITEQFPPTQAQHTEDDFDLAFGPSDDTQGDASVQVPVTPAEKIKSAEKAVQSIADSLRFEVNRFGGRVRNPSVVADRWNLLIDLQEFRGKCRAAIGELVYAASSTFGEISRPLVIPEYANDLAESLAVRQAWITLTRAAGPLNARLQIASVEQQRPLLLAVQRELDHFQSSRGYLHMRAADKRFVIAFVRELSETFAKRTFGRPAQQLVEGFAKFLDSMAVINRREILINHDREAFAECGTLLEQAGLYLGVGEHGKAMGKMIQALAVATRLYGRDRYLDDYLVLRLRWPLEHLVDNSISTAVEELRACLAESGNHAPGSIF